MRKVVKAYQNLMQDKLDRPKKIMAWQPLHAVPESDLPLVYVDSEQTSYRPSTVYDVRTHVVQIWVYVSIKDTVWDDDECVVAYKERLHCYMEEIDENFKLLSNTILWSIRKADCIFLDWQKIVLNQDNFVVQYSLVSQWSYRWYRWFVNFQVNTEWKR